MAVVRPLLQDVFATATPKARDVVDALAQYLGDVPSTDFFAVGLGLRNRHHLARLLQREGLPPAKELSDWISVAVWLAAWEESGTSLFRQAIKSNREPATCYRIVKRITGMSWERLKSLGLVWHLTRLAERCRPADGRELRPAPKQASGAA